MLRIARRGRLSCALVAALFAPSDAAAQALQAGAAETAANVFTAGDQSTPAVACSQAGPCVVAWLSLGQDGNPYGIHFRRYDAGGLPSLAEGEVTTSASWLGDIDVCMDSTGAFTVAWSAESTVPGDAADVLVRRFDASGSPLGAAIVAHAATAGVQGWSRVACAADGRFVVGWVEIDAMLDSDWGAFAQRFDATGAPEGSRIHLNDVTPDFQYLEDLSMTPAGDFAALWSDRQAPPETTALRLRLFDADGAAVGPSTVVVQNDAASFYPFVGNHWIRGAGLAHAESGEIVVAWSEIYYLCHDEFELDCEYDLGDVWRRRYGSDGLPLGYPWNLSGPSGDDVVKGWLRPAVAAGARTALVAWGSSSDASTPDATIDVQPVLIGSELPQNTMQANDAMAGGRQQPAVAAASGERYLVAWTADGQDGSGLGVFARYFCYDSDGDGVCDVADPCPLEVINDADGDGYCGDVDNCPALANPGQQDADGDDHGDACDVCPGFDDNLDADEDGLPDGCDACPLDAGNDGDTDSVCGDVDNCPLVANAGQEDSDGDTVGDACDLCAGFDDASDSDGDGNPDACDDCPLPESEGGLLERAKLSLRKIGNGVSGDDKLSLRGARREHSYDARPDLHGARVVVLGSHGERLVDATLPAGSYAGSGTAGWRRAKNGSWSFRDATSSPVAGIVRMSAKQGSRYGTGVSIAAKGGDYPVQPGHAPLGISVVVGDPSLSEGFCAERRFVALDCAEAGGGTTLHCK